MADWPFGDTQFAPESVRKLAALIRRRNAVDESIAALIGRPAEKGHMGEWLASCIFNIDLAASATQRGYDGTFRSGNFVGRSVNVKWYARREGLLDINPSSLPDFYLVLAGPKAAAAPSKSATRPLVIAEVFLFEANALLKSLSARGVRIGTATSVTAGEWERARVYPTADAPSSVSELLSAFSPASG